MVEFRRIIEVMLNDIVNLINYLKINVLETICRSLEISGTSQHLESNLVLSFIVSHFAQVNAFSERISRFIRLGQRLKLLGILYLFKIVYRLIKK